MNDVNRGWKLFGKKYHRAERVMTSGFTPPMPCNQLVGWLDQTTHDFDGSPTGALVPTDLKPCKRCFPDGDAVNATGAARVDDTARRGRATKGALTQWR